MTIAIGQLPKVLGVPDGDGNFFPVPDVGASDLVSLLGPAVGVMLLST